MLRKTSLVFALVLLVPGVLAAAGEGHAHGKPAQRVDKELLTMRLRQATRQSRGKGIDKSKTDRDNGNTRSFPHFTSSMTVGGHNAFTGQSFPFTMVGFPPESGKTANFKSVIVPLRRHLRSTSADGGSLVSRYCSIAASSISRQVSTRSVRYCSYASR